MIVSIVLLVIIIVVVVVVVVVVATFVPSGYDRRSSTINKQHGNNKQHFE